MHISAIGDGDIAFGKGGAAEAFGALLIEALVGFGKHGCGGVQPSQLATLRAAA
jgi:hypothetical protein